MFDLQPTLESDLALLRPLTMSDFEALFSVASDPLLWEQHPNSDRYQGPVFREFFDTAMASGGAFVIIDRADGKIIGSSRFYDLDEELGFVHIGYTFLARSHWGTTFNRSVKNLMIEHAFKTMNAVRFQIGAQNIRSQTAIERLGATRVGIADLPDANGITALHFLYEIQRPQ